MPIETKWHIENHVIHVRFYGVVTKADVEQYAVDLLALLKAAEQVHDGKVNAIADGRHVESFPPIYLMAKTGLPVMRQKNRGVMAMITTNRALRAVVELTAHTFPSIPLGVRFVTTLEQALEIADTYQQPVSHIG
jgi:hypothetical protein